eukprot:144523-Prymnesium_polylepis.1
MLSSEQGGSRHEGRQRVLGKSVKRTTPLNNLKSAGCSLLIGTTRVDVSELVGLAAKPVGEASGE